MSHPAWNDHPVVNARYNHPQLGEIWAMQVSGAHADWAAVVGATGRTLGHVVDTRADRGGEPSAEMPADEDTKPYDAFDAGGRFIVETHSLRGALAAIGNRA